MPAGSANLLQRAVERPGDANDRALAAVGDPRRLVRSLDHAVRPRARAERDEAPTRPLAGSNQPRWPLPYAVNQTPPSGASATSPGCRCAGASRAASCARCSSRRARLPRPGEGEQQQHPKTRECRVAIDSAWQAPHARGRRRARAHYIQRMRHAVFRLVSKEPLHDPAAAPDPGARRETRTTTCYMCACRCGIRVHLRDGVVRYIDGNPEHPINKGVICAKGGAGAMKQYSPARLTRPLRRKAGAERGAGEFEPISWDEALATLEPEAAAPARDNAAEVRALHRPRPDAGPHVAVRAPVRHAQLRGPRRLLLRQHGRGDDVHVRRLVLGVRRPRPRAREAVRDAGHRGGSPQQPHEDRAFEVQARRRPLRHRQPGAHRLQRDRRRMDPRAPRNRRRAAARALARARARGTRRPRLPAPLHQRAAARAHRCRRSRARLLRAAPPGRRRAHLRPAQPVAVGRDDEGARGRRRAARGRHRRRARWRVRAARRPSRAPSYALLRERLDEYTPELAERITGVPAARIEALAREARRDARVRAGVRACPSPGPTAGAIATSTSTRGRSPSTRCAASRRTATASTRCARSPC